MTTLKILNLLAYLIASGFITVYVGRVLFANGRHFLLSMLKEEALTDAVNKILLVGYYLVNLGYVTILLAFGTPVDSLSELISTVATSVSRIVLTLAILHYINITAAIVWSKISINHKHQ